MVFVGICRATNANKQMINFFIFWASPILRPELLATLAPLVTGYSEKLDASLIIKI